MWDRTSIKFLAPHPETGLMATTMILLAVIVMLLALVLAVMFGRFGLRIFARILAVTVVGFLLFGGWRILASSLLAQP